MVYLIYGQEQYLVREWKNEIIKEYCPEKDDMNYVRFEGTSVNTKNIADAVNTFPFFADKRVVLCENTDLFKKASDISKVIDSCPETTVLVFAEVNVDKKTKAYKSVQKCGEVKEAKTINATTAAKWVSKKASQLGYSIKKEAIEKLISLYGTDLFKLETEMDKLTAYNESGEISLIDIDEISTEQGMDKLFSLLDNIGNKNKDAAFKDYYQLKLLKYDLNKILLLLSRHIRILMEVKSIKDKKDAAKLCGIPPFTVSNYEKQSKNFSSEDLMKMVNACAGSIEKAFTGVSTVETEVTKLLTNFTA